jgi:hypothetical protein
MKATDKIENIVKKMSFKAGPEMDKDLWAETSKAQNEFHKTILAPGQNNIRRTIMKSPITKLAAAVVIIIACLIGLSLWRNTGSGIALADVLAQIEQAKAVKYKTTFKVFGSEDPNELWADECYTTLMSQEYGTKTTYEKRDPHGEKITEAVKYYYPYQKIREIQINHTKKTYKRRVTDGQAQNERSRSQEDPLSYLKEFLKLKYESIGRSILDGNEVAGFRTTDPNYKYKGPRFTNIKKDPQYDTKLWVDVKTLLPVRIEYLTNDTYDGGKTRSFLQEVDYNFQWDVPVDASTLEAPPIPDGYAIQEMFPEPANEENAIGGLKQCVELFGNYTERIDLTYFWAESEKSETTAALRLKEELKGLTGLERDNKKLDALKPIRFLNKFYVELAKKDSAYYGKIVTPKDADKVLLRWKISDNEYRVIYGDLHTETVTPEKLTELESTLPK